MSRRSFVAAGAVGLGSLALRPRRTVADVLDPSATGLWGAARTGQGLVALWSSGGRPAVVQLSGRGPVEVTSLVAAPALSLPASIAAGGATTVLGADAQVSTRRHEVRTGHLPPSVQAALANEPDGPLSLDGLEVHVVSPSTPAARTLDGSDADVPMPAVAGGIATAAFLDGPAAWVALQHPPSAEGDHCTGLLVRAGDRTALAVDGLGAAGPASLVGASASPLVAVADGDGRLRVWRLGDEVVELPSPGPGDDVAVHVADDHPVAVLVSDAGAVLLALGSDGWEVVRDVAGTEGSARVLAVSGGVPEFLVEVPDGVVLVDGEGRVRA